MPPATSAARLERQASARADGMDSPVVAVSDVTPPVRVAVVVASPLLREGLARLLGDRPSVELVAVVERVADLEVTSAVVDVLVVQVGAPSELAAVDLTERGTRVVTLHDDLSPAAAARLIQDFGVVPVDTHSPAPVFVDAVVGASTRAPLRWSRPAIGPMPLSPRERSVLALVAEGKTSREIAAELAISARTVESHKQRILERLGVASQAQAVALAARTGLLRAPVVAGPAST